MAKIQYLTYYIHLTDAAQVSAYQAQYPQGVNRAPYNPGPPEGGAAIEFGAPFRGYTQPAVASAPFTWTPWSGLGSSGGPYPINVATFQRHTGGFWGIGGTTTRYYWMGKFVLAGTPVPIDADTGDPVESVAMSQRRFAIGFDQGWIESEANLETGLNTNGLINALRGRQFSRSLHGRGYCLSLSTSTIQMTVAEYTGGSHTSSWERLYFKPLIFDSAPIQLVSWLNAGLTGACLVMVSGGGIIVYNGGSGVSSGVTIGTAGSLTLNTWSRIDALIEFNSVAGPSGTGRLRIYLNGSLVFDSGAITVAMGGLGVASSIHSKTTLGTQGPMAATQAEVAVDDWINAAMPTADSNGDFVSADWLYGSRVLEVIPRSFSVNHGASWVGDIRILKQSGMLASDTVDPTLTSSTGGALIEVETDFAESINEHPEALGIACMTVGAMSQRGVTVAHGSVGYNINGAGPVDVAVVEPNGSKRWHSALYRPSGLTVPQAVTSLRLRYTKGAAAEAAIVAALRASVEVIGIWGPEDCHPLILGTGNPVPDFGDQPAVHNAPYSRSPWARPSVSGPNSPYIITSGTYVGNGTGQSLTFRAPIHWLYIRPSSAAAQGGARWFSSMMNAHRGQTREQWPQGMTEAREDRTFVPGLGEDVQQQRFLIDLCGSNSNVNQLGVTYAYIAISDPGMRFMCNGGFAHDSGHTGTLQNPLPNSGFLPEWLFLFHESDSTLGGSYAKGPGNAAASISPFDAVPITTAITFATGRLDTQPNMLVAGMFEMAYSAWRRADGNNDPGQPAVVAIGSYTGNATNPRVIPITPASGKRPIFVLVVPENANGAHFRDFAHTGTISSLYTGADVATNGITAGDVDSFTVQTSLNTNAVVFNYFVLLGSATAGVGGFSPSGEFIPVEADSPVDGPWPDDPDEPTEPVEPPATSPPGEPDLDVDTILGTEDDNVGGTEGGDFCEAYTRELVNIALGHIGISKEIENLVTEESEAAAVARRHVRADVNRTLRDYPWDFATRYENLVLHSGTTAAPVNNDWIFAYEAPNAMMLARRISNVATGRKFDLAPIPFREGLIDGVPVIYCNAEGSTAVPLVLEYTVRIDCPAFYGDALFREALTWKFAASFAQSLSRDPAKQKFALEMYTGTLHRATSVDAKEQQQEKPGDADWILGRN